MGGEPTCMFNPGGKGTHKFDSRFLLGVFEMKLCSNWGFQSTHMSHYYTLTQNVERSQVSVSASSINISAKNPWRRPLVQNIHFEGAWCEPAQRFRVLQKQVRTLFSYLFLLGDTYCTNFSLSSNRVLNGEQGPNQPGLYPIHGNGVDTHTYQHTTTLTH